MSLQEVEAALSFRWQRAVSALAGIARGEADFLTSRAAKLAPNNDEVKKLREEVVKLLERNTDGACKWSFRSRFFWPGAISFAADAASGVLVAPTSSRARRPFSSPPRVGDNPQIRIAVMLICAPGLHAAETDTGYLTAGLTHRFMQ